MSEYSASYDRTTKIISAVVCALLFGLSVFGPHLVFGVISALIVIFAYAYSPRGYRIAERAIVVRRLIGDVHFRLEGVREARRATSDDLSGAIRLWGNGGLFGYYGLFRTFRLGKCWWYVTDRRNTVVVITETKTALFSPDDVDGFLAAVLAASPGPAGLPGVPRRFESRRSPATWAGIAVGVLALAVAAFAFMYSPGPPSCTLTPGALTIHDRFYPVTIGAADVDVARIRVIDITTDTEWRPTARTNGFANTHYRSGWFRVANGQKVRLYAAGGKRLVLLPPNNSGSPVLLQVNQPDEFVSELRREWAGLQGWAVYSSNASASYRLFAYTD